MLKIHVKTDKKFRKKFEGQNIVQCYECGGFGHMRAECANTKKKEKMEKNQTFVVSWSDASSSEEENGADEEEEAVVAVAFAAPEVAKNEDSESDSEFGADELYTRYETACDTLQKTQELARRLGELKLKAEQKLEEKEVELQHVMTELEKSQTKVKSLEDGRNSC